MGGLDRRVSKLENGGGSKCPECGFDGNCSNVEIVVEWCDADSEYPGPEETVYCETCGEATTTVVVWDDEDLP